jgi:hypothetical protein
MFIKTSVVEQMSLAPSVKKHSLSGKHLLIALYLLDRLLIHLISINICPYAPWIEGYQHIIHQNRHLNILGF